MVDAFIGNVGCQVIGWLSSPAADGAWLGAADQDHDADDPVQLYADERRQRYHVDQAPERLGAGQEHGAHDDGEGDGKSDGRHPGIRLALEETGGTEKGDRPQPNDDHGPGRPGTGPDKDDVSLMLMLGFLDAPCGRVRLPPGRR